MLPTREGSGTAGDGVLIHSKFASAARDLADARIISFNDTERSAEAIRAAVEMQIADCRARMTRLSQQVSEDHTHRLAAIFLPGLTQPKAIGAAGHGPSAARSQ